MEDNKGIARRIKNNRNHNAKWAALVAVVKIPPAMREIWVRSLGWEDLLEVGMATYLSILSWRIPMDTGA